MKDKVADQHKIFEFAQSRGDYKLAEHYKVFGLIFHRE